jgi:hypothetical protein
MPDSQHPQPRRLDTQETIQATIQATSLIQPKSSAINSPSDLPYLCQQLAQEEPSNGACLLQCPELLPSNNDFPDDDTEFSKNVTSSFRQKSKNNPENKLEFLQISSKKHKSQRYRKPNPTWVNTTEPNEHLSEMVAMVQQRIGDKSGLQRRLICADPSGPSMLLQCGHPLDDYVQETGDGVTTAMGIVSLDNSAFEVILGDWELGWCSLLIAGAPNIFVVISPQSTALFEAKIKERFRTDASCSQFMRHLGILPSLNFLHGQGIQFSIMYQKVGDAAIIFPGSYCYGFGTGSNYSREISWAPRDWNVENIGYKSCSEDCGATEILTKPRKRRQTHQDRGPRSDEEGLVSSETIWIETAATVDIEPLNLQEETEETEEPQGQDQQCCQVDHVDEHVREVLQRARTEGDEYVKGQALVAGKSWSTIRQWEASR